MHKSLIALALVAGCGGSDRAADNVAGGSAAAGAATVHPSGGGADATVASTASLAGLWEGGPANRPNQLCMVEKGGRTQFGLVVWAANLDSCSGAGVVERSGSALTLRMSGDSACKVEASLEGGKLVFAKAVGEGCVDYYCGHRARLDGASFTQKGATAADAKKATDVAGDPLCG